MVVSASFRLFRCFLLLLVSIVSVIACRVVVLRLSWFLLYVYSRGYVIGVSCFSGTAVLGGFGRKVFVIGVLLVLLDKIV